MSSYGTRSAQQASPIEISKGAASSSSSSNQPGQNDLSSSVLFGSPLSSSVGKSKRPSTFKTRRLSTSGAGRVALSLPVVAGFPTPRGRSATVGEEDEEEGLIKPGSRKPSQTYACEVCSKLYAHERCLVKHRWEHTAHWKEASKLLLSKHQQVQLLEAAAILKAASSGSSLPDEKGFWPAAVSPPTSGLLGSPLLNIDSLTSPRFRNSPRLAASPSLHFHSPSSFNSPHFPTIPPRPSSSRDSPEADAELDEEDEDTGESVSTGDDALDDGMFDLDLGGPGREGMDLEVDASSESGRSRSAGHDSGFGSMQPPMGFFQAHASGKGASMI